MGYGDHMDPTSSSKALGEVIRSRREELELSPEQLGIDAGYGKGAGVSISRIEGGITKPSGPRFAGIALRLQLTPEQLHDAAAAHAARKQSQGGNSG